MPDQQDPEHQKYRQALSQIIDDPALNTEQKVNLIVAMGNGETPPGLLSLFDSQIPGPRFTEVTLQVGTRMWRLFGQDVAGDALRGRKITSIAVVSWGCEGEDVGANRPYADPIYLHQAVGNPEHVETRLMFDEPDTGKIMNCFLRFHLTKGVGVIRNEEYLGKFAKRVDTVRLRIEHQPE